MKKTNDQKKDRQCRYLSDDFDEICVNGDCPACGDFCPCVHYPEICTYYEQNDAVTCSEGTGKAWYRVPREKQTQCDICVHLEKCQSNGNLIEITIASDTTRHFIGQCSGCCPIKDEETE